MRNLSNYTDEELVSLSEVSIEDELKSRGFKYGWYKDVKYNGCIYILVNPAFPNLVKIGYADDVQRRVKTLNSNSGLPDPYHIYATYKVKKRLEDLKLHKLIDSLDSDLRHARNKEFYEMSPEKAYEIISAIAEINGDTDRLQLNPLGDKFFNTTNVAPNNADAQPSLVPAVARASRLNFLELKIPVGSRIFFIEDENLVITVNSDYTVAFENNTYTLSALVRLLKQRNGTANTSGAYQGGKFFKYKGKILTDIRAEIEASSNS